MCTSTGVNDEDYKVYLEERNQLVVSERETAHQFDKAVLTLAAGALALSIAFIEKVAPTPSPCSTYFLIGAWILFCLSILSTLMSFLTSQAACRQQRDILDSDIKGGSGCNSNAAATLTLILNYVSITFFIIGVFSLITFSTINISKGGEEIMDKERKDQAGYVPPKQPAQKPIREIGEGYVPPKPPQKPTKPEKK